MLGPSLMSSTISTLFHGLQWLLATIRKDACWGIEAVCDEKWAWLVPYLVTIASALSASGKLSILDLGRSIHMLPIKLRLEEVEAVRNSLVDMHVKCSAISEANYVFEMIVHKDVIIGMQWFQAVGAETSQITQILNHKQHTIERDRDLRGWARCLRPRNRRERSIDEMIYTRLQDDYNRFSQELTQKD